VYVIVRSPAIDCYLTKAGHKLSSLGPCLSTWATASAPVDIPTGAIVDIPTSAIVDIPTGTIVDIPTGTIVDIPTGTIVDIPLGRGVVRFWERRPSLQANGFVLNFQSLSGRMMAPLKASPTSLVHRTMVSS
jgi:hypothetical protein